MLADLAQAIGTYLDNVFVIQFSWWVVLGFLAQAMFFMRFAVQWIASERAGRSVVPTAFWIFSVIGSLLLLIYALQRKDPVFIAGLSTCATCNSSCAAVNRHLHRVEIGVWAHSDHVGGRAEFMNLPPSPDISKI